MPFLFLMYASINLPYMGQHTLYTCHRYNQLPYMTIMCLSLGLYDNIAVGLIDFPVHKFSGRLHALRTRTSICFSYR